jgi:hypothetical protein
MDASTVFQVRPLSIVAQGEDFLVGDPERGEFVVLPEIGVVVIDLLRSGRTLEDATQAATERAGTDVDVSAFAASLCELGFVDEAVAAPEPRPEPTDATRIRPRWARLVNGPLAWTLAALGPIGATAIFVARPRLLPKPHDVFFLDTPVRSIAAVTVLLLLIGSVHELCHWTTARAEGVRATIRVNRRLYLLVLETNLTGLWGLPRRRRYWPLLAGMAFDALMLCSVLLARLGDQLGWWHLATGVAKLFAALTFIELTTIITQCFVFLRTDVYAVLLTATGCFDLWRTTRLELRRRLRCITSTQRAELAAAHGRDRAVARYFVWVYGAGLLLAGWYFVTLFLPATWRLLSWMVRSLGTAGVAHVAFWEALAYGLIMLTPRLLTLGVALRDLVRRLLARTRTGPPRLTTTGHDVGTG